MWLVADRLDASLVSEEGTLRDAMIALDRGARQIALALDASGRLVGVATDGDVRRALLAGASIEDPLGPLLTRAFVAVGVAEGRAEAIELMRARRIGAIPVIDGDGRPAGLHLLHEFLEPVERANWAVVMAGGQGVRLRPLTETLPKPMLRVAGRPILERIVLHLVGFGISRIFLSVGYMADVIEAHFGDGAQFGCRIEYLREERPLGTAGALGILPEPPTAAVLVMNGDLVTSADLGGLLDFHASGGFAATVGVRRYLHSVPFGCVERSGDRVVGLVEKPTLEREINSGIYAVAPESVAMVRPGSPIAMPDLIGELLDRGQPVGAFEIEDDWIDVGQRDQLDQARSGG
jgi:dTDP-glucose pyrophosphorylase